MVYTNYKKRKTFIRTQKSYLFYLNPIVTLHILHPPKSFIHETFVHCVHIYNLVSRGRKKKKLHDLNIKSDIII